MTDYDEMFQAACEQLSTGPFIKITISSPTAKEAGYHKVTVVPMHGKKGLFYQLAMYYGTQVKHVNVHSLENLTLSLKELLPACYAQWDMVFPEKAVKVLAGKNGGHKVIVNNQTNTAAPGGHNKLKQYFFSEGTPVPWLVELGVMNKEGRVLSDKQKKFRQINRFVELVLDTARILPDNPYIIDFGCGKSYLTFALYDCLRQLGKHPRIFGLDLKSDVVGQCNRLAKRFGFDGLSFAAGDIKDFDTSGLPQVDMVVTLHACDTATDYALYNAVAWGAGVIMSVPCCHHELLPLTENDAMSPLLKHGILKERFCALLTDAMRASLLEASGYKCQVIEFVDMEHTPKNIMLRAVKNRSGADNRKEAMLAFLELKDMFNASPVLYRLLNETPGHGVENQ